MIQLIGIKSECDSEIRQKFSILPSMMEVSLHKLSNIFKEVVIISTCNRIEIYLESDIPSETVIDRIIKTLDWDILFAPFLFHLEDKSAVKHLMEVACGFHSRILGEDQILGQIKNAYFTAQSNNTIKGKLHRLFQLAIACGKKFKSCSEIHKIPVSFSSIVVKEALRRQSKKFIILGFGEIGKLTLNYLVNSDSDIIYIAVRDVATVEKKWLQHEKVKIIQFEDKEQYYHEVDCIISCTSSSYRVIHKEDLPDKKLLIFDIALPKDVSSDVESLSNVILFDIDNISAIDEKNKVRRKEKMKIHRFIIEDYIAIYAKWLKMRELSPEIQKLKDFGNKVADKRIESFKNKINTKEPVIFAEALLKSTSNLFVNRAIEVLKSEKLEGREEECFRILQKIFYPLN